MNRAWEALATGQLKCKKIVLIKKKDQDNFLVNDMACVQHLGPVVLDNSARDLTSTCVILGQIKINIQKQK